MLASHRFQILGRVVGSSRTRAIVYTLPKATLRVLQWSMPPFATSFPCSPWISFSTFPNPSHRYCTKINRMNCEQIMLLFSLHAPDPHCSVFSPKTLQVGYS